LQPQKEFFFYLSGHLLFGARLTDGDTLVYGPLEHKGVLGMSLFNINSSSLMVIFLLSFVGFGLTGCPNPPSPDDSGNHQDSRSDSRSPGREIPICQFTGDEKYGLVISGMGLVTFFSEVEGVEFGTSTQVTFREGIALMGSLLDEWEYEWRDVNVLKLPDADLRTGISRQQLVHETNLILLGKDPESSFIERILELQELARPAFSLDGAILEKGSFRSKRARNPIAPDCHQVESITLNVERVREFKGETTWIDLLD
jgi:hypothetical protein